MTEGIMLITGTIAVGLIMGAVQALKMAGMPSRFAPIAAVVLGLVAGLAQYKQGLQPDIVSGLVSGMSIGLIAAGAYSGSKAIAGGYEPDPAPSAPPS